MKNKLLYLSLALLLILTLALFVGCTEVPPAETPTDGEEVTTVAPEDPTDTPTQPADTVAPDDSIETVEPDKTKVPDMAVTGKGYDIYQLPEDQNWGYRYGCTYLYNDDGSIDAYFASPGADGEWDWIAYRRSEDGGKTWSPEKMVLTPTQGSMDDYSNCDPGVVYFGGYYYLGYTSTLNSTGACNNVFVARSKNPDGPFEKWNGNGWGGYDPQPIFYYYENYNKFGMGEPSFVELNGTLYIYYTNAAPSGEYTMVATADATDENWPATIRHHGTAIKKETDSLDIKYVEDWGKFVGVATGSRMGPSSWIGVFESNDGFTFEMVDIVREGTLTHLHNAGLSSRRNGHIKLSEDADKLCVIYAHGEGWGTWNTRVQPISLTLSSGNDMVAERQKPCLKEDFVRGEAVPEDQRHIELIRPEQDVYTYHLGRGSFTLRFNSFDSYFGKKLIKKGSMDLTFKVYDESVCTVDNATWKVELKGVGTTGVEVWYGEHVFLFFVRVTEDRESGNASEPLELVPVADTYYIYLPERSLYQPQLRAQMKWGDGSFTEYYVDKSDVVMTFSGYDPKIISVSDLGIVTALKTGETEVTLTAKGKSCKIKVVVTDKIEDGFYRIENIAEIDYTDLDFTQAFTKDAIAHSNSTAISYDSAEGALKCEVTGGDAQFYMNYSGAMEEINAADYKAIEITYKCTPETSSKASQIQLFFMVGNVTEPTESCALKRTLVKNGEYQTLTINMEKLAYWNGTINTIRVDFFDQSEVGDTMYIQSIKLIEK